MRYYGNITKQLQFILVKRGVKNIKLGFFLLVSGFRISKKCKQTSNFTLPTEELKGRGL